MNPSDGFLALTVRNKLAQGVVPSSLCPGYGSEDDTRPRFNVDNWNKAISDGTGFAFENVKPRANLLSDFLPSHAKMIKSLDCTCNSGFFQNLSDGKICI